MGNCPTGRSNVTTSESPPESPPEPVISDYPGNMLVSLCDYPSYGLSEFTMHKGERLTIISDDGDFMLVKSTTTGCESYVPIEYTATVTDRWLFTGISRFIAEELLMVADNQTGAFIVRESQSLRDCYSLSVLRRASSTVLDSVKHYRVRRLENRWFYISPGTTFPSLRRLVEHYSESADGLCSPLREPCFIRGADSTTEEGGPVPLAARRPTVRWKDITRSMIFRRHRAESENSLVSAGLKESISSYLYMTEASEQEYALSWDG